MPDPLPDRSRVLAPFAVILLLCVAATDRIGHGRGMRVAGPEIASLLLRSLRWAHRAVHRGEFGPIIGRRGKADLVALDAVERRFGLRFAPDQLAAAGVHLPDPEPSEEAA
jgi:hypothetical protein